MILRLVGMPEKLQKKAKPAEEESDYDVTDSEEVEDQQDEEATEDQFEKCTFSQDSFGTVAANSKENKLQLAVSNFDLMKTKQQVEAENRAFKPGGVQPSPDEINDFFDGVKAKAQAANEKSSSTTPAHQKEAEAIEKEDVQKSTPESVCKFVHTD